MRTGVVPLRPLTMGELLDGAVALLRGHARVFIAAGLVLAAAEQAVLYPVRVAALADPLYLRPYDDLLAEYLFMIAIGFATETAIISMLAGLTARAAGPALLGDRMTARQLLSPRGGRFAPVVLVSLVLGAVAGLAAAVCLLPWVPVYALIGLIVPALIIDRVGPFRATGRGVVLAVRHGIRAAGIRVVGYLAWGAVRIALGFGSLALVDLVLSGLGVQASRLVAAAVWAGVNAVAYPALSSLDAVLHLESRMRSEGLDIAVGRALAAGRPAAGALVVPR